MAITADKTFENVSTGLRAFVDSWANAHIRTAMPGIVETFNPDIGRATIRLALDLPALVEGEVPRQQALLPNVPILLPGNSRWAVSVNLERGDNVMVVWSKFGLNDWKSRGYQEATAGTLFDYNGCVAIPWHNQADHEAPSTGLRIASADGSTVIELTETGIRIDCPESMEIQVGGTQKVVKENLIDAINAALTALNGGGEAALLQKELYLTDKLRG